MNYAAIINSPIGYLGIQLSSDFTHISHVDFLDNNHQQHLPQHPLAKKAVAEIQYYFQNPHAQFTIPLQLEGTELQQKVWHAMQKIPVGNTLTYSDLAINLNTSPRVIGNACRANPIPVFIPCHRIVAKNHLGGFFGSRSGRPIKMKAWLLEHEANFKKF